MFIPDFLPVPFEWLHENFLWDDKGHCHMPSNHQKKTSFRHVHRWLQFWIIAPYFQSKTLKGWKEKKNVNKQWRNCWLVNKNCWNVWRGFWVQRRSSVRCVFIAVVATFESSNCIEGRRFCEGHPHPTPHGHRHPSPPTQKSKNKNELCLKHCKYW